MSMPREQEYPMLPLVAIFWEDPDAEDGVDAVAHVEDALVLHLTRPDGLHVRLTVDELTLLYHFVISETYRQAQEVPTFSRLEGCQSTNHTECYGQLWQCASCGKTVCYAEGSNDDPELCDDCWAKKYPLRTTPSPLDDDIPF